MKSCARRMIKCVFLSRTAPDPSHVRSTRVPIAHVCISNLHVSLAKVSFRVVFGPMEVHHGKGGSHVPLFNCERLQV
ncbi:hypothetical protein Q8A67_005518 [Cirrhinus molitorella]|uniref:Uncharacterized protein n=1 Tax=Cirrhinus molitorella TaxID=172907 RepID=A0AA88TSQ1_9TELE|nr:hypothetical protein Q8A67_005518 [Cirrhinus molitorella]